MLLIPALGRQRQVYFWVRGQHGLQSEFQDSQDYTEKPCFEKPKKKKKKKKKKKGKENNCIIKIADSETLSIH
jgi:rRNA processing protein Gar1